jgi:hypothetical protein
VVVGAALTFATGSALERRRERSTRAQADREAMYELRAAARLMRDELLEGLSSIEGALHAGAWPPFAPTAVQWHACAPVLARRLSLDQWATVCIAYGRILEIAQDSDLRQNPDLSEHDQERLEDDHGEIHQAVELLFEITGDAAEAAALGRRLLESGTTRERA